MTERSGWRVLPWPLAVLSGFSMLLLAGKAAAGGELFDGCIEVRGRLVTTTVDHDLPRLALAAIENGEPVVRYNPGRLPSLPARALGAGLAVADANLGRVARSSTPRRFGGLREDAGCPAAAGSRAAVGGEGAAQSLCGRLRRSLVAMPEPLPR